MLLKASSLLLSASAFLQTAYLCTARNTSTHEQLFLILPNCRKNWRIPLLLQQSLYSLLALRTIKPNFRTLSFDCLFVRSRQLYIYYLCLRAAILSHVTAGDPGELSLSLCSFVSISWNLEPPLHSSCWDSLHSSSWETNFPTSETFITLCMWSIQEFLN